MPDACGGSTTQQCFAGLSPAGGRLMADRSADVNLSRPGVPPPAIHAASQYLELLFDTPLVLSRSSTPNYLDDGPLVLLEGATDADRLRAWELESAATAFWLLFLER